LPQLDQAPLYNQINPDGQCLLATKVDLLRTPLAVFLCPSSTAPAINSARPSPVGVGTAATLATANYVGNSGLWLSPGIWSGFIMTSGAPPPLAGFSQRCRFQDVTDGLSNVIFVGERTWRMPNLAPFCGHPSAALWGGQFINNQSDILATGQYPMAPVAFQQVRLNHCNFSAAHYSSDHEGGAHFLLGDGSVRFISENIDSAQYTIGTGPVVVAGSINGTFERLIHRSDGNVVGDF
jgi:hypothetical protein